MNDNKLKVYDRWPAKYVFFEYPLRLRIEAIQIHELCGTIMKTCVVTMEVFTD